MKYLALSFLFLISCGKEYNNVQEEDCKEQISSVEDKTFVQRGQLWNKEKIIVCWDEENILPYEQRKQLEDNVYYGWDTQISLDFIGWDLCSNTETPDIIIKSQKEDIVINGVSFQGMAKHFGMPYNNEPNVITLNITKIQMKHLIIHEFGHILNLQHEQNREDTPEWCKEFMNTLGITQNTIENETVVGPFDNDSIMNYCSPSVDKPSCWDLAEAIMYYGEENE